MSSVAAPAAKEDDVRNLVYLASCDTADFGYEGCAVWCIPHGVSSCHVLSRAFGDALHEA